MLIDLHAHQLTREMFDHDEHWGPHWNQGSLQIGDWMLGTTDPKPSLDEFIDQHWSPEPRLAAMDARGVDRFVLSMPLHMVMYHTPFEFNERFSRAVNESLAKFCAHSPDRFTFWAHAPLQDPARAVAEIRRSITELGAKGLTMGCANFGGLEVHDPKFDPVWEAVCELDVPLFVHGYNQSVTWQDRAVDDPFDTTSILGMISDESIFFWYLVNAGVLDRFPDLKIYITHAGGYVPYHLGRFDIDNQTMAPDSRNQKPVLEYMENFYFDLDVHMAPMRRAIVDIVGVDRLLYGDNFGGSDCHDGDLTDGIGLSDAEREQIRSGNASRLIEF
jgi:aminocarboxymuconate-semialdehyde decarboxylase